MSDHAHIPSLISEDYKELNRQLHESNPNYGTSGARVAKLVASYMKNLGSRDVLDYGCGKRMLEQALGIPISNYDPAIAGLDTPPAPADIVVCADVLEHIEPAFLDAVLDDLQRVTRRVGLYTVCTAPAMKFLADGRNAHLIVENQDWWVPRFARRFAVQNVQVVENEFLIIVQPRPADS